MPVAYRMRTSATSWRMQPSIDVLGHPDASSEPITPPSSWSITRGCIVAGHRSEMLTPSRTSSVAKQVGPLDRLASASATNLLGRRGTRDRCAKVRELAAPHERTSQSRSIGHPEDQAQYVDAAAVELSPQCLGHHHVERFLRAVGHHVPVHRRGRHPRKPERYRPPAFLHGRLEVIAEPHGYQTVPLYEGHGDFQRL